MTNDIYPIDPDGVWCQVLSSVPPGRAALFLDRDGVVVEEVDYLRRVEDVVLCPGAASVIAAANAEIVPVVLVTNQAGIGRGYYGWPEFQAVQEAIQTALAAEGAHVDAVYACPHHRDGKGVFAHPNHPARKPNPGMLWRAAKDLALDLPRSWLVGDTASDIEAARNAGLAGALHVLTGHGRTERSAASALCGPAFTVRTMPSIIDALSLPIFGASRAHRPGPAA